MNRTTFVSVTATAFLAVVGGVPSGVPAPEASAFSQSSFSGGVIVFTKVSEDQTQEEMPEIYIMRPDGTDQRRITTNTHFDIGAELSPDGRTVAFHQMRDGRCCFIQLIDIDGFNERTLATGLFPSWSPDGRRIAFNDPGGGGDIWTIEPDGTGLTNVTQTPWGEARADWSPNGQWIAFQSNRSGNQDIWVMDAKGSNAVQLTTNPFADQAPDWSPDGRQIVFQSNRFDPRFDIFVIDAQGVEEALAASPGRDLDPNWSPDGRQIVFDSDRNHIAQQIRQIFIMNADGSNQLAITDLPHEDGHASWSHGPVSAVARSIFPGVRFFSTTAARR